MTLHTTGFAGMETRTTADITLSKKAVTNTSIAGPLERDWKYICAVSDKYGTRKEITFHLVVSGDSLAILEHPGNAEAAVGDEVYLHVEATGTDLSYQWQYSKNGGTSWLNCKSTGCNTDTFSFTMKATLAGRQYRGVVTADGTELISDGATVNLQ